MSLLITIFGLILGLGGMGGKQSLPASNQSLCYMVEADTAITVPKEKLEDPQCKSKLGDKTYVRIRKNIKIMNGKTDEARGSTGTCEENDSMREIADLADNSRIFWVPSNFKRDDTSQLVYVLLRRDSSYHYFDVYLDEALIGNIPEFITDCKEKGGVVPVLENTLSTFPPQSISVTDTEFNSQIGQNFNNAGYEVAYQKYLPDFNVNFFIRQDEAEIPAGAEQVGILTKTNQKESRSYDAFFHGGVIYLEGSTEKKIWLYNATLDKPPRSDPVHASTMQLKALQMVSTNDWTYSTPNCKPAIYLYPPKTTAVSVKVSPRGQITNSIPKYSKNGWLVEAGPSGFIRPLLGDPARSYPYLFYEANLTGLRIPTEGWIVVKENLENFFNRILDKIGLNPKEKLDFLSYWLPKLSDGNKWFIALVGDKELNRMEPLDIEPAPDNLIRVRFYFENLDNQTGKAQLNKLLNLDDMANIKAAQRKGFTAVDWGGIIENGTCGSNEISK